MSEPVVEPSAVIAPRSSVPIQTGRQRFYQTYNTQYVSAPPVGGGTGGGPGIGSRTNNFFYRQFQKGPGNSPQVTVRNNLPGFLGSRTIILFTWITAMIMVSLDEWKTHHVLPRPARLWYTSITYFLLGLTAMADPLVPLAVAMAIGLTIAVAYQYYTGSGSFGQGKAAKPAAPSTDQRIQEPRGSVTQG